MNRKDLAEFFDKNGFLQFEVDIFKLIVKDVTSEPIIRMVNERNEIYYNYKEGIWDFSKYRLEISNVYYNMDAFVIDGQGHRHADPVKLLNHYQHFSKQEDELIKLSKKQE
jgi:hypothetical protein